MKDRPLVTPPIPENEEERLAALRSYEVLDTPPEEPFDRITRLASRFFDTPIALVSLVDGERQWFKSRVGLDAAETPRDVAFCAYAINDDDVMTVPDATNDKRFAENPLVTGEPGIRFYAGAPLINADGHKLGTICVIDTKPRDFAADEMATLQDMAHMVVEQLDLKRTASTDALTGVLNRGKWSELAEAEFRRSARYGVALSVMMIDIDRFKSINDQYGHGTGDEVIRAMASACTSLLREQDIFGRYGGEEFGLVLPHTDARGAEQLADRIRSHIGTLDVSVAGQTIKFTVSIGVTACDLAREEIWDSVHRADQALYDAKDQGRNRVVVRAPVAYPGQDEKSGARPALATADT